MKTSFCLLLSMSVLLTSRAWALCGCKRDDRACLDSCVHIASECLKGCEGEYACLQSCADGSFLEFKALEGEPLERIDRQEEQEEEAMLLQKQDVAQEHVAEEQAAFNYEEAMENEALEAEEDEAEDDEDLLEEQHVMKHETEDEEAAAADEEVAAEQQDTTEDEAVYQEEEHEAELSANDIPEAELAEEDEPVEEQAIENIQLDNVDREVLEAERREKENKILAVAAKMDDNKDDQNHQASLASADDHRDNGSSHSGKDGDHAHTTVTQHLTVQEHNGVQPTGAGQEHDRSSANYTHHATTTAVLAFAIFSAALLV